MKIAVLGAHNCESQNTRFMSLLIDDILALDAGALTSSQPFSSQQKLKAILLTHHHYDHVRDIPAIGMNLFLNEVSVDVYSIRSVYDALAAHMLNGELYPRFFEHPQKCPVLRFTAVEPGKVFQVEGYSVLPLSMNHAVPTVGYYVTSSEGKSVFYTGDTGTGLAESLKDISPQLLIVEVTAPNRYEYSIKGPGHLTPNLLKQELAGFLKLRGYLPQVVTVHMNPGLEQEIAAELKLVSEDMDTAITPAFEGMQLQV